MELIQELKQEHVDLLNFLSSLLKNHNRQERFEILQKSKDILFAHLKKEDNFLYPRLQEAAKKEGHIKVILSLFGDEMEQITEIVVDFYNKYSSIEAIEASQFPKDFSKFYILLQKRIMKEETTLFREYENLKKH